jgi:adenosylhomocysteine nucleosidase
LSKLGIIAALPAEAACLYNKKSSISTPVEIQKNIFLCLSGIGYESACYATKKLLDFNVNALISWGVAGAINTSLSPGDLILADLILSEDKTYQTSTEWKNKLTEYFRKSPCKVLKGSIASSREICASIIDKKNLLDKTGGLAVDMESVAIAETATNNSLDFLVIRSIADTADVSIPEAVLKHTNNLGQPELSKFVLSCVLKPGQIRDISILAKNYKMALKTLNNIAEDLKKQNFFYD